MLVGADSNEMKAKFTFCITNFANLGFTLLMTPTCDTPSTFQIR
jgi:hypothetical protein